MKKTIICFLLLFISSTVIASPASTYLEITDPAYRQVEKLAAFGLCDYPMIDQRPYLRGEFARLVSQAITKWDEIESKSSADAGYSNFHKNINRRNYIRGIIKDLTEKFREELIDSGRLEGEKRAIRYHPFETLKADTVYLSSAPLVIPPVDGVGSVSASVNPFLNYREGRHAIDGFQEAWESYHRFKLSNYFSFLVHPRFELDLLRSGTESARASILIQEGYGVFQISDIALTVGRASEVWGAGEYGGMLLTNNARPLDIIKLSTPSPFRFPWVFKYLGQWKATVFGANLGPEQVRRYGWLTGYRLTYMPVKYLEMAFGNTTMMGGEGTPYMSAWDIFGEFWGFRPAGTDPNSPNKTDHIMEAMLLVRIPPAWGLELYGHIANDDKRDTLKRFFRDGSSYVAGFHIPRLFTSGRSDLRFEFRRMCALMYRHGLFTNGYTLDDLFMGDNLGPAALGARAVYNVDFSESVSARFSFDWEKRSSDQHASEVEADGTLGDVVVTQYGPSDERFRLAAEPRFYIGKGLEMKLMAGYERQLNAGYEPGVSKNNWLAGVLFSLYVEPYLGLPSR